jgi:hypothetical protein
VSLPPQPSPNHQNLSNKKQNPAHHSSPKAAVNSATNVDINMILHLAPYKDRQRGGRLCSNG